MKKSFLKKATWIGIIAIVVLSVLRNIFSAYWLLDIFVHFKVQYSFVALLFLIPVVLFFQKKIIALILLTISLVWNIVCIYPYYFNSKHNETSKNIDLKISSINLLSSNTDFLAVKNHILKENPDILILMEFNSVWKKQLQQVLKKYMYQKLLPRPDNFGIALLSKIEMKSAVVAFGLRSKPSIVSDFNINKKSVSVIATHPMPPISQQAFENRNNQLQYIVKHRPNFSKYLIVVGDFNTSSFSNQFNRLTEHDLRDSRIGFGLLPTWPADFFPLQTTLDHCLISENIDVIKRSTGENIGSDHLPISIQLHLQ